MATATPIIVRSIEVDPELVAEGIREGDSLDLAVRTSDLPEARVDGRDPGGVAWERFVEEALTEAAPDIAEVMRRAIERRLPWTWEADR